MEKHKKRGNFQLQHEDKIIEEDVALKQYITTHYKDPFGHAKPSS
jgi:hypothetical protein